jgi:hypothetical protein
VVDVRPRCDNDPARPAQACAYATTLAEAADEFERSINQLDSSARSITWN